MISSQQISYSQNLSSSVSCDVPLNLDYLEENAQLPEKGIVTDQTISETGLTIPSLWWAKEQFDPFAGRLINNWIAYQKEGRIDMVVNRQLWSILDYMKRYRFIHQFGTIAREYKYNLRIFNQNKRCLATYTCNFNTMPNQCQINFEPSGRTGLQIDTFTQNR